MLQRAQVIPCSGPPYGLLQTTDLPNRNLTTWPWPGSLQLGRARTVPQQSTHHRSKHSLSMFPTVNLVYNTTRAPQYGPTFTLQQQVATHKQWFKLALQLQAPIFYRCWYHRAGPTEPFIMGAKSHLITGAQDANTFLILVLNSITMILSMEK